MHLTRQAIEGGTSLIDRQRCDGADQGIVQAHAVECRSRGDLVRRLAGRGEGEPAADDIEIGGVRIVGQRRCQERRAGGGREAREGAGNAATGGQDGVAMAKLQRA